MDTNQRAEFDSLLAHVITDRRAFLAGSPATGFALAVQPVSAQTITTDAAGLAAGEVKIPAKGVEMPAYRAMPAEGGPFPTVLVVQEILGVHEYIRDLGRTHRLDVRRAQPGAQGRRRVSWFKVYL